MRSSARSPSTTLEAGGGGFDVDRRDDRDGVRPAPPARRRLRRRWVRPPAAWSPAECRCVGSAGGVGEAVEEPAATGGIGGGVDLGPTDSPRAGAGARGTPGPDDGASGSEPAGSRPASGGRGAGVGGRRLPLGRRRLRHHRTAAVGSGGTSTSTWTSTSTTTPRPQAGAGPQLRRRGPGSASDERRPERRRLGATLPPRWPPTVVGRWTPQQCVAFLPPPHPHCSCQMSSWSRTACYFAATGHCRDPGIRSNKLRARLH